MSGIDTPPQAAYDRAMKGTDSPDGVGPLLREIQLELPVGQSTRVWFVKCGRLKKGTDLPPTHPDAYRWWVECRQHRVAPDGPEDLS